jgi:uncharacterized protein involved in propanediol utilization
MSPEYRRQIQCLQRNASAVAAGHAGEVLQGAVQTGGRTRRLLMSLPAPPLRTEAEVVATPGQSLRIEPAWASKALQAAVALFRWFERPLPAVTVKLRSNIPPGKGCGSSTADMLATIRALLLYSGLTMTEESIARLIVSVEEATDGSVLSRPALFRHREGTVDEYLPGEFPAMRVMVIDAQPAAAINTIDMPRARYCPQQLAAFELLVARLRRAFRDRNAHEFGQVATASAQISQTFLPKPHFASLTQLVLNEGGYGLSVSHSGTVVAALLPIDTESDTLQRIARSAECLGMEFLTQYALGGMSRGVDLPDTNFAAIAPRGSGRAFACGK